MNATLHAPKVDAMHGHWDDPHAFWAELRANAPVAQAGPAAPGEDLISDIVQAEVDGQRLSDAEVFGFLPDLRLDPDFPPPIIGGMGFRAPQALHVRFRLGEGAPQ